MESGRGRKMDELRARDWVVFLCVYRWFAGEHGTSIHNLDGNVSRLVQFHLVQKIRDKKSNMVRLESDM